MRVGIQVFYCIVLLFTGCRFTDDQKHVASKNTVENTTAIRKQAIHKEPVPAQTQPYRGQYCLIKKVYAHADTNYIEADYIQFLMGEKAIEAARKKGEAEMVLDDYYIVNENPKTRMLALAKDVIIQVVITEDGKSFFVDGNDNLLHKKLQDGIFVLQIENGVVKKIKEQFLP
jgi:hypothetical protein